MSLMYLYNKECLDTLVGFCRYTCSIFVWTEVVFKRAHCHFVVFFTNRGHCIIHVKLLLLIHGNTNLVVRYT
jgi:hypothetical protein